MGKQITHSSHTLQLVGGVIIFTNCGAVAKNKLQLLARECKGPPPKSSSCDRAYHLRAWHKGTAPRADGDHWPYRRLQYPLAYGHSIHELREKKTGQRAAADIVLNHGEIISSNDNRANYSPQLTQFDEDEASLASDIEVSPLYAELNQKT